VPDVRVDGGIVVVTYLMSIRPTRGEIILSGRVPWVIEGAFGMSDVLADLEHRTSGAWRSPVARPRSR
jgi:hypothetical protein